MVMSFLAIAFSSLVMARTCGNDLDSARAIAQQVYAHLQPAQVLKITVDRVGEHRIAGMFVSGVKFHVPLTRRALTDEVVGLVQATFAASTVEEVDVRVVVPLTVGRGTVVSGDNALPVFREVFTVTSLRREALPALRQRIDTNRGIFWDDWFLHQQLLTATP